MIPRSPLDDPAVAAFAWAIARDIDSGAAGEPELETAGRLFMEALASDRMNVRRNDPDAEFPRRYVRHTWSLEGSELIDITPIWTAPAPMFADYLDALRCLGDVHGLDIDPVIADAILDYPYPVGSDAICHP